jgi:GH15 family glucan-1,4-alpha-glucosidase
MSWAGCDRLARIAARLRIGDAAGRWRRQADLMRTRILAGCWSAKRNSFVGTFGGAELDATTLLLAEVGLVSADDPRFVTTVEAVGSGLGVGDFLYRYRHPDDFGTPQTAFTICSFWYVNALAAIGKTDQAREHFSRLLERRNNLGLLSEDLDPATGLLWGNYPQTYSMVGIVNSAVRLSRSWEEAL